MHPDIRQQIDQIAGDYLSGATDITRRAAEMLASLPVYSDATTSQAFRRELTVVARELAAAQPSMASLLSLVNRVLLAADETDDFGRSLVAVQHAAEDFATALSRRPTQIAQTALPLVHDGATIMTISSSSMVLAALQHAREAGKDIRVICLESRPQREGVEFAKLLAESGIHVTLVVDAAMAHFMKDVILVIFGADTVLPKGLVNKIGTHAVALVADAHGVPAYGLAGTEKFLPASLLKRFEIEQQNPREILDEPAPAHTSATPSTSMNVINLYFDLTPLDLIAGIATEEGVLTPANIEEMLTGIEVHPALLRS
ncbi:MAG: translation initiation factor eIF-2B [Anaerolineae bacterium]